MEDFLKDFSNFVGMLIPIIAVAAFLASVIMFAKTKGTRDALLQTAENYKNLAESYKETAEQMEYQKDCCEEEKEELEQRLEAAQRAMEIAVDEIIAGFKRAGASK